MRIYTAILAFLICRATAGVYAEVLIKPDNPDINYYGRFDRTNVANAVRFDWPGSIIEAVFPGPLIGVELNDGGNSYFNVEIDGVVVDTLTPSSTSRRIIRTNLSTDTNHTIRLILRTNARICSFGGFYLANGKTLAPKPGRPLRKMEFTGDSWTAGNVIGSKTVDNRKDYNASLTFARLTSKAYHAEDMLIARGGCGLVRSNGGEATMPTRYLRTLCEGTATWDFSSWIPDVVIILLGINDFINGVSDANFRTAYTNFVKTVRGYYDSVPVILAGLTDNVSGHNILNNVKTVAQSFTNVYTFSSPVTYAGAKSVWYHPNQEQHHQIADALIPVIKQATGWDTMPPVETSRPHLRENVSRLLYSGTWTIKTATDAVSFPAEIVNGKAEITIHNCRGQLVQHVITTRRKVSLKKDYGLPDGMYVITGSTIRGQFKPYSP